VRAGAGEWSEARLFEVAATDAPAGRREIERIVERFLESRLPKAGLAIAPPQVPSTFTPFGPTRPLFADTHFTPPACAGTFTDVDNTNPLCGWIEQAYADDIVGSCDTAPLRFCPDDTVSRQQAARLLERGVQERWGLSGNAGTHAGTHFIGTTDDEALDFRVNGERALRIAPRVDASIGSSPSLIAGWESKFITGGDT